jgi:transcriptional regulator with XRE-family HTH domain
LPVLTLGQRLRAARLLAGYQRARHFAEALGIRENTYCRYERDEAMPSYDCLARICQLLNLDVSEIVVPPGMSSDQSDGAASIPSSSKPSDPISPGHGNGDARLSISEPARSGVRRAAEPITSAALCSLHAWRLSQILAAQTAPDDLEASAHVSLVTDYYFSLKKDPYPTLMPFLSDQNDEKSVSNSDLKMAIGRFLEAYHNHLKSILSSD